MKEQTKQPADIRIQADTAEQESTAIYGGPEAY